MNSLKRTLSLVLVLVMVLGLFGIASATSFSDDAKIQYNEAVDVMTGIGAINGMGDGTFNPTGTVTRAQAAKMVAYAVLGKTVADTLYGVNSSFSDVSYPAYDWAIPSIEHLVRVGAIAGRGDGTFDPNGEVTAYEIGKMLLVCLGIKGEYTGSSWTLDVAINATNAKLFAGRASNAALLSDAATREECALYCFNAIMYSPSGTSTEKVWSITNIDPDTGKVTYGWVDTTVVAKDSIAASVYPTLKHVTDDADDLGRPASIWIYGSKKTQISNTLAVDPIATFSTTVTAAALYKAVGGNYFDIPMVVNDKDGQDESTYTADAIKNDTTAANVVPNSGNGVITEVYQVASNGNEDDFLIVQIVPSFASLNVSTTKATTSKGAYTTYTVGNESGVVFSSVVDAEEDQDTALINGTVAKGDYVIYYQGDSCLYIEEVDTIAGVLSSISNTGVVTVGTTKTAQAAAFSPTPGGALGVSSSVGTYYVDSFGYILGVQKATAGINAVMLLATTSYSELVNNQIVTSYAAVIALPDGTVKTVPTTQKVHTDANTAQTTANYIGKVFTTAEDTSGRYTFATTATATNFTGITNGVATLTTDVYASSSTKFIFIDYAYSSAAGARIPTGTVTVYTGVSNVPTYSGADAYAVVGTTTATVADVVFIGNDVRATVSNAYTYVIGTYTTTTSGTVYDTIVNGAYSTLTVPTGATGDTPLVGKTLYSSITISGSSVVTTVKADTDTVTATSIANVSGLLFLNGNYASKSIASDAPVYTITKSTGAIDVGTGADLVTAVTSGTIYIVYNSAATAVSAVYILV